VSGLALSSVIFPYGASRKPPNISDHFKLPGACCSARRMSGLAFYSVQRVCVENNPSGLHRSYSKIE